VGGHVRDDDGALRLGPCEQHLLGRDIFALRDVADDSGHRSLRLRERAAPIQGQSSTGIERRRETDMRAE
jgi:hypothetical protein